MTTENYDGHDRRKGVSEGWHLDKKVPLSLIFAMLVQAGMVIVAIADMKRDIELIKAEVQVLHQRDSGIELQTREYIRGINEHLVRLDAKVDRLIERGNK